MRKIRNPDKIINQSNLIEETAKKLDYYPKDVKKVLDTYMDCITDHVFDVDENTKVISIRILPSIQFYIKAVPKRTGKGLLNTDSEIIHERLEYDITVGDRFKRTLTSIFRAKNKIYDGWYNQFIKDKRKKELEILERQQKRFMFGEADYSDTSINSLDVVHPVEIKGTFGERLKKNKKETKKKGRKKT